VLVDQKDIINDQVVQFRSSFTSMLSFTSQAWIWA